MKTLTEEDYERAAQALGCDIPAIKAVCEVEAPRGGFLDDGVTPVILFEAHHFSRLTDHQYDATNASISSRTWNRTLYSGGMGEHKRLQQAAALNREAALQSASWGKPQIMGFNWALTGANSLQAFINDMYRSEGAQLDLFVGFVKNSGLAGFLRDHDWASFAARYNGSGYKQNSYDTKLANAWSKFNA